MSSPGPSIAIKSRRCCFVILPMTMPTAREALLTLENICQKSRAFLSAPRELNSRIIESEFTYHRIH